LIQSINIVTDKE